MTNNEPRAYSTSDPAAVAAYLAARAAEQEFARHVIADAKALGNNKGALRSSSPFGGDETLGLSPDDPQNPPVGWIYSKGRGYLIPKRGKVGDAARRWLVDHQPPKETDARAVLEQHGLPLNDLLGSTRDGGMRISKPSIGHYNGELWALYRGTPGHWGGGDNQPPITWTPRNLSEYYAAREAAHAADVEHAAAAAGSGG